MMLRARPVLSYRTGGRSEASQRQATTSTRARIRPGASATAPSALTGLVFDAAGNRLGPTHAKKGSRRYRYYVSAAENDPIRIPAQELEDVVVRELLACLADELWLHELCDDDAIQRRAILVNAKRLGKSLLSAKLQTRIDTSRSLVRCIVVGERAITITVQGEVLGAPDRTPHRKAAISLKRCGRAMRLISASGKPAPVAPDPMLITLLSRAQDWFARLATGKACALEAIAKDEAVTSSWVARVIHLAFLAPDIAQAIVDGRQPPDLTTKRLMRLVPLPMAWQAQREHLGF